MPCLVGGLTRFALGSNSIGRLCLCFNLYMYCFVHILPSWRKVSLPFTNTNQLSALSGCCCMLGEEVLLLLLCSRILVPQSKPNRLQKPKTNNKHNKQTNTDDVEEREEYSSSSAQIGQAKSRHYLQFASIRETHSAAARTQPMRNTPRYKSHAHGMYVQQIRFAMVSVATRAGRSQTNPRYLFSTLYDINRPIFISALPVIILGTSVS